MDFLAAIAFRAISIIAMSMVFGLLGAPFAALICFIIGRSRGLTEVHARTGAWYSILFILPWLYLVLRMLGLNLSDKVAQLGYLVLYGVWLCGAIAFAAVGLGFVIFPDDEFRIGDVVLVISGGLFIGCAWFVSIRRLLRRNETSPIESSAPMRYAYAALHALWLLFAIGIVLAGMFEANVKDKSEVASVLYTAAFTMFVIWVVAMFRFRFSKADEWDYHTSRPHSELPLHSAYIEPFVHLYLLIIIPALCGIAIWFIMLIATPW
ncbi:MAG: hypothetical protein OXH22_01270 [Chloroflexi bacterium]|nr:hypothetical protein [Chloroflexota bacterium]